jgi:hypothetical protein
MTDRQRRNAINALAEAIPQALNGNATLVISHLQAVMHCLGLDDLNVGENAFSAMRRGQAPKDKAEAKAHDDAQRVEDLKERNAALERQVNGLRAELQRHKEALRISIGESSDLEQQLGVYQDNCVCSLRL